MTIGIIGAMKIEVEHLKKMMTNVKIERVSGIDFYSGELGGKNVIVAVSGVGKVNAAMCTQTMILKYSPAIIINTGVAGGISDEVGICDIVVAKAVVQHDMDTSPLGDPVGYISGINIVEIPCSSYVAENLVKAAEKVGDKNVFTGIVATGDQFLNKLEDVKRISDRFNAIAGEMEGGSIGQVCYINGVDFGVVRIISDKGDDSSHIDFNEFLEIAVKTSVQLILNFLDMLK